MVNHIQNSTKKALVFTAHPDDHLCCAGTLMLLKDKGFKIQEIVATGGEKGPWWASETEQKTDFTKEELKKERKKEISEASKIIGIDQTNFLGLPDGEVEMDFKIVEKIMEIVRKRKPMIVLTMNSKDYHHDHREVSKIVLESLARASWSYRFELGKPYKVPAVLLMEGFYFGRSHLVVDVTSFAKRKKAVLDAYKSQINPQEKKLLESMNYYRAFLTREEKALSAEAFEIPEEFPIYFNKLIEFF